MVDVKNISVEPVPLADGRLLKPGSTARLSLRDPHNRAHVTAGVLLELEPTQPAPVAKTAPKEKTPS